MFRIIKLVFFGLFVSLAFISCEKEMSEENGGILGAPGTQGGTAAYTLDGSVIPCSAPVISGTYLVGTALDITNTVVIDIDVTTIGTYTISTAVINGMSFTGAGTFATTGAQSVTLFGSGAPETATSTIFVPGTSGCSFIITSTGGVGPTTSVYTFAGAPGNCTSPVIAGTYTAGTALTASNTVAVTVDVTTAGTYAITTAAVNGISFSGAGTFATADPGQVVTLTGNGTPTAAGANDYTTSSTGCAFTITATPAGGTSVYTLTGAPGACTAPVVAGTYLVGLPLGTGNTITLTADVTTAGTYILSTNTVNGITFSGNGTFAVGTGQTIILTGSGTPVAANTSSFTVGTNGCSFPVTTTTPPPAVYTFTGAPGACNPISVDGSYFTANPLSSANTATIEVNVTTAGTYTITTNTVNGMTFSKTGVFAGTGPQSLILAGSGTPAAVGTNTFTVGTGGCTFPVIVTAPTSPCTGLVDGTFVMTGQFTLNGFSFGASLGSQYQVTIQDTPVQLDVFFPGGSPPAPGTYSIGTVTMNCLNSDFTDWNATSGSVYVSTDGTGNTVVEFCNVTFIGTPLAGGNITAMGAGKMVF
jgi:hypothetical protein